jgi:hypothetical protein
MTDDQKMMLLLGVGGAVALYFIVRHGGNVSTASHGSMVPDAVAQTVPGPAYPNTNPIQLGNIEVGGSPVNLTYNYAPPIPTLAVGSNTGGECGCDDGCEAAGQKVGVQTIAPVMLQNAVTNYQHFQNRITKTQGTVPGGNPPIPENGTKRV